MTDYKLSLRNKILDTAIKAFCERGIKAVKMDDVASALGISKRTLYEIFDTKEVVLYEGLKRYHSQKDEKLRSYAQRHDVLDIIIYLYRCHMEDTGTLPPMIYDELSKFPRIVTYLEGNRQKNQKRFLQFISRGVDEGYFLEGVNYNLVANLFEAMNKYIHHHRLYERYSFEDLFFNMLFVTLRGFCTPKGIGKLDTFYKESNK